jgi:hypothetical protein
VSELGSVARANGLESEVDLKDRLDGLSDGLARAEQAVEALEQATPSGWTAARQRLAAQLETLRGRLVETGERVSLRAAAARAERIAALEPLLEKGLVKGLDGELYGAIAPSLVRLVQERLRGLGLYSGPADGLLEQTTMRALARFQEQNGLQPTGVPTARTRHALLGS